MTVDQRLRADHARALAYGVGFDLAGIARLGPMGSTGRLRDWLAAGYHGEMTYIERGAALRADSTRPEPGMRSAVVVALDYGGRQPSGPIARYARGADYHDIMRSMLRELHAALERECGEAFAARPFVDTGPVLERELAQKAGLGWIGKNTMLINPSQGSFFFLGALFVAADLEPDQPFDADRCGTCTRCLDACPTQAFPAPRVLDATKCISYLTIEHRTSIPVELRPLISDLVFGCDVCQEVCPWNERFAREPRPGPLAPIPEHVDPDPEAFLQFDDAAARARFKASPMTRARRRGLARNATIAIGNRRHVASIPALRRALLDDPAPLVRAHAAWALGRFTGDPGAREALEDSREVETDVSVRHEIASALGAVN